MDIIKSDFGDAFQSKHQLIGKHQYTGFDRLLAQLQIETFKIWSKFVK